MEITERTCTEMLGQAILSMSQSMNAIHRNWVGCLDLEVKDSGISVHFLIRQMKSVGEHVASSVGEGCDMGESRKECGGLGNCQPEQALNSCSLYH